MDADLESKTVKELRAELKKRGIPVSGRKAELIEKLKKNAMKEDEGTEAESAAEGAPSSPQADEQQHTHEEPKSGEGQGAAMADDAEASGSTGKGKEESAHPGEGEKEQHASLSGDEASATSGASTSAKEVSGARTTTKSAAKGEAMASLASTASLRKSQGPGPVRPNGAATKANPNRKLTKNERRRLRKKQQKQKAGEKQPQDNTPEPAPASGDNDVVVEYVRATSADDLKGTEFEELADVFEKFSRPEDLTGDQDRLTEEEEEEEGEEETTKEKNQRDEDFRSGKEKKRNGHDATSARLSRRKKKEMIRPTVASLKQRVAHPEVVETHDVAAPDPDLLIHLKSYRNTVPVPRHWSRKRKYLDAKRGFLKPPFKLPQFIEDTGISRIRETAMEQDNRKSVKQMMREHIRPKLGRIEIDYQVLEDAFLRYQTKPRLSCHGDLYYEGKEFVKSRDHLKPGRLSKRLREALGMPTGANAALAPPPWLTNMQRYGPPPSYPHLRIPGLNAPLPRGAAFGNHPGGWGMPPVDAQGNPLYGDVFGAAEANEADDEATALKQSHHWGDLLSESEEEEEEEEEAEGQETKEGAEGGAEEHKEGMEAKHPLGEALSAASRNVPPGRAVATEGSGTRSTVPGAETPSTLSLRKQLASGTDSVEPGQTAASARPSASQAAPPRPLYQVLQQESVPAEGLSATGHRYVIPSEGLHAATAAAAPASASTTTAASAQTGTARGKRTREGTTIALDPQELGALNKDTLEERYNEQLKRQRQEYEAGTDPSELEALMEEHERKRRRVEGRKSKDARYF